jgi:hypothetical protein
MHRYQHWAECEALQLDVACVDLGSDDAVKHWAERTEFTHGVPDIVITVRTQTAILCLLMLEHHTSLSFFCIATITLIV